MLTRILQLVRGQDWWFYKIPPLLAAGYATALLFPSPPGHTLGVLSGVLAAICMVASFGYVVNDLFDIEQDQRSGRRNTMARLGNGTRLLLCVIPIAAAFGSLRLIGAGRAAFWLLALNLLLPALYSIPPVRLKQRGFLGALADSGAVHALPTALMVTAIAPASYGSEPSYWVFLAAACGWAFFSGLRGNIVHQVTDRGADELAGVQTFGGRLGPQRARTLTFGALVPFEVASLVTFLWLVVPSAPTVGIFLVLYLLLEVQKIRLGWKLPMFERATQSSERYIPLLNNEFYELWLPLGLALQLALVDVRFIAVFVFQVVAFLPNLYVRGCVVRDLLLPASAYNE